MLVVHFSEFQRPPDRELVANNILAFTIFISLVTDRAEAKDSQELLRV